MLPGGGIFASGLNRALTSSLANALSQEALDPEGDINLLSTGLAGLTGYMSTPELAGNVRAGIDTAGMSPGEAAARFGAGTPEALAKEGTIGFMQGAENIGREGIASLSDFVTGTGETFKKFSGDPGSLFDAGVKGARFPGVKELGKAIAIPASQGSGDLAYSFASKAMRDFEEEQAEELRQAGLSETEMQLARRDAITSSMLAAAFDQEDIDATLDELGLLNLAQGGIVSLKDGGRAGFDNGGFTFSKRIRDEYNANVKEGYEGSIEDYIIEFYGEEYLDPTYAKGGVVSLAEGGMLDFGGREMDLRGGGFVPIGKKEKADDVPARLSKNEFVMTADAVRAAGGGSVNKGAQRMYNLMNDLEARA
jgi:hypothetical protein